VGMPLNGLSIADDYTITHDYYNQRDADRELNIVFPITRLKELHSTGYIGAVSELHFSFMGHIGGHHVSTLVNEVPHSSAKYKRIQR
jgi:D-proline reductase (dithiol) PrdB